jgi:hypothetical protein
MECGEQVIVLHLEPSACLSYNTIGGATVFEAPVHASI